MRLPALVEPKSYPSDLPRPVVPKLAPRLDRIATSATLAMSDLVAQKRRQGADVVSFSVGEPDFVTPLHVREAAMQALRDGKTHYTPGAGIPELRQAIATTEKRDAKIPCEAKDILVTPAKHGIFLAVMALADKGDEVIIPDPAWVSYEPIIGWAHGKAVGVALDADAGFRMTPDAVAEAITKKTQAIVLNSPSNPTGGVNTPADVKGILDLAIDHDLWIVSDEIYQKLQYEGKPVSPASLPGGFDRTFTIDGLSKSFAMTGWRMGWIVAPPVAMEAVSRLQSQSITHVTSFAQYGALAAVSGPQDSVASMKKEFKARRKVMLEGLRGLPGVTCPEPKGAFYCFPHFNPKKWGGMDDETLSLAMLDKANVAVTAGSAFGSRGKNHVRFSYATSREKIEEGIRRLKKWQRLL